MLALEEQGDWSAIGGVRSFGKSELGLLRPILRAESYCAAVQHATIRSIWMIRYHQSYCARLLHRIGDSDFSRLAWRSPLMRMPQT